MVTGDSEEQRPAWYLEPFEGESVSHYFGRFRRQPAVSISNPARLSRLAKMGPVLSRWEQFYFNPPPTQTELEAIAKLISLDVEKLMALFPPSGERTLHRSTRLCAACYRDAPYHRMEWQFQSVAGCEKHRLRLLSRCPACDTKIALPRDWELGACKQCGMKFVSMVKRQKCY
ncbi:TniQ family protein [Leptothoe spongobia]|uniref:TniQ family protein n=1 Tax=Leptothoe spongobia TAU-MAC 1115 TaxID=1967444 RepID=A0A947DDP8_9CYAN|nr:TniQ family protein [Leptothoe spongobia]MBT9315113.1 TniQ family protein [Leptothoe spongobia TAU-MAC 1115]